MESSGAAIFAEGLRKRYGETNALDGCDLGVAAGTVHGLLGPNGAGKTTTVRVLTTLLRPDEGVARVAGFDVLRQAAEVRFRIGLVGQHAAVDEILTGRQNLVMFGRLYHMTRRSARSRAAELLDLFGLTEAADKPLRAYSGGMRRRLDLAAGLILSPEILFLDEPTTGLDPRARGEVWDAVRALRKEGTTVLLTTQYLEEADQLADRISVVDSGRIVAEGSPGELKSMIGDDRIEVVLHDTDDLHRAARAIEGVVGGDAEIDVDTRRVSAPAHDRMAALTEVIKALEHAGAPAEDVTVRRPTLDEAFLHITGRKETRA